MARRKNTWYGSLKSYGVSHWGANPPRAYLDVVLEDCPQEGRVVCVWIDAATLDQVLQEIRAEMASPES